ncbi:hypothetical protein [Hymenobacter aerophilus]|uniref:hypothetical protein n=1 Tax=Hymenobacter aerophilus TaxID=119644 RepID=UPI0003A2664A|nr:hypothetical protein [Hymenobacter aerophilus]
MTDSASAPRQKWGAFLRHAHWLLLIPLLIDLGYSYVEHLNVMHDGDMVSHIIPHPNIQEILDDPFGLRALLKGEKYASPNRYFAHESLLLYMRNVPLMLQAFVEPIYSTYMACAIAKVLIQASLIALLAYYISFNSKINSRNLLIAALLATPFFQTAGYSGQMGIIDRSITYTFFYSLPMVGLLLYFVPLHRAVFSSTPQPISRPWQVALPILAVVLALNGPLIPAVGGLICLALALSLLAKVRKAEHLSLRAGVRRLSKRPYWPILAQLLFFVFCCGYSLYIGTFNNANIPLFSLAEIYGKLWGGIPQEFLSELGFPLLVAAVFVNILLLKLSPQNEKTATMFTIAKWLLVLSVIYVALLPLGGYREYRPNIVRRDTIIPVTLALIYFFGVSTLYLLQHGPPRFNRLYLPTLVALVAVYSLADVANLRDNNCETDCMRIIANSTEPIVHLEADCGVMNWGTITDPNVSAQAAEMMVHWNIMKEKKLFYH